MPKNLLEGVDKHWKWSKMNGEELFAIDYGIWGIEFLNCLKIDNQANW